MAEALRARQGLRNTPRSGVRDGTAASGGRHDKAQHAVRILPAGHAVGPRFTGRRLRLQSPAGAKSGHVLLDRRADLLSLQGSSAQQSGDGAGPRRHRHAALQPTAVIGVSRIAAVPSRTLAPPSEVENVVVYLKDAPARDVTPTRVAIRQRDETFTPRVVAVPVGSDGGLSERRPVLPQRLLALPLPGVQPRALSRAASRASVRFDKPGIVKVFCDIHSHMSATVIVFNHPWFTVPDAEGGFEIDEPAAGQPAARRLARAAGRHDDARAHRGRPDAHRWSSCFPFPPSEAAAAARHAHDGRHVHHRRGDPVGGVHGAAGGRPRSRARCRDSRSCRSASAPFRASRPSASGTRPRRWPAFAENSTLKAALDTYFTEGDLRTREAAVTTSAPPP